MAAVGDAQAAAGLEPAAMAPSAANPAELFVEYQLDIKDGSPFGKTMVTELTNGWCGYIPTKRAMEGGSYEARLAHSSKLASETGDMIVGATLKLLGDVKGM